MAVQRTSGSLGQNPGKTLPPVRQRTEIKIRGGWNFSEKAGDHLAGLLRVQGILEFIKSDQNTHCC
jgi:hypothetical protein